MHDLISLYKKFYCKKQASTPVTPVYNYNTPDIPNDQDEYTWGNLGSNAALGIGGDLAFGTVGGGVAGLYSGAEAAKQGLGFAPGFAKGFSNGFRSMSMTGALTGGLKGVSALAKGCLPFEAVMGAGLGIYDNIDSAVRINQLEGQDFVNHLQDRHNNRALISTWQNVANSKSTPEFLGRAGMGVLSFIPEAYQYLTSRGTNAQTEHILNNLKNHEIDGYHDRSWWQDMAAYIPFSGYFMKDGEHNRVTAGARQLSDQALAKGLTGSVNYYDALSKARDAGRQLDANEMSRITDRKFYEDAKARGKMYPGMSFDQYRQYRNFKKTSGSRMTQEEFMTGNISADTHNADQSNALAKEYAALKAPETT